MKAAQEQMTSYRVSNDFHGYEAITKSTDQVKRLVRKSKPVNCKSRTVITKLENGKPVCRMDFNNDQLQEIS